MANLASGIFTLVRIAPESTFNVLPTGPSGPTMSDIPFVDFSLSPEITKVVDSQIFGDTMHRYVVPTTEKVAGTISGEVSHTNFDWLLTCMFYNDWSTNVLKVGNTQTSYSIEAAAPEIDQYLLYKGCVVDKLALTFTPAGLVTYKADMVGGSFSVGTMTNAGTVTPVTAAAPLATVTATIKEGGSTVGYITGATINFDRKTVVNYALGSPTPVRLTTSFINVTGSLDVFFEDEVLLAKFTANTSTTIDWTLTDGTNTYEIKLPNMFYETSNYTINGTGPILVKMNFTGVYDVGTSTVATITRSS